MAVINSGYGVFGQDKLVALLGYFSSMLFSPLPSIDFHQDLAGDRGRCPQAAQKKKCQHCEAMVSLKEDPRFSSGNAVSFCWRECFQLKAEIHSRSESVGAALAKAEEVERENKAMLARARRVEGEVGAPRHSGQHDALSRHSFRSNDHQCGAGGSVC